MKPQQAMAATWDNMLDSDRGPAVFFHGRKRELQAFREARSLARTTNGGTVFLIQGAQGAGKTALLYECGKRADEDGWRVVQIGSDALFDPSELADYLRVPYESKSSTTAQKEGSGRVGWAAVAEVSGSRTHGQTTEYGGLTVKKLLRNAANPGGLVLVLDEAQTLEQEIGKPYDSVLTRNLAHIHNGTAGAPVILLAGGLSTSEDVFNKFGISRFADYGKIYLGRLSPESERSVIHDWLVRAGGAYGDSNDLARWIDTIAAETYGWPQHIAAYAPPVAKWLYEAGGALSDRFPMEVLALGHRRRQRYNESRLRGMKKADTMALGELLFQKGDGAVLDEDELAAIFSRKRTPEQAETVFLHALHKGVIANTEPHAYAVPISSMQKWLVGLYEKNRSTLLPASPPDAEPTAGHFRAPQKRRRRNSDHGQDR